MYNTTQTQNSKFDLFELVTLDYIELTKGQKGLGKYLEISQTRAISFHRLYFNLIRLLCPAKQAMTDIQNSKSFSRPCKEKLTPAGTSYINCVLLAIIYHRERLGNDDIVLAKKVLADPCKRAFYPIVGGGGR